MGWEGWWRGGRRGWVEDAVGALFESGFELEEDIRMEIFCRWKRNSDTKGSISAGSEVSLSASSSS